MRLRHRNRAFFSAKIRSFPHHLRTDYPTNMLFNSYEFIFLFLPLTLLGFHWIGKQGHHRSAIAWLVSASLFFYGWWNPAYLFLILFSILFNYGMGALIKGATNSSQMKTLLILGITINIGLLGYYKYANFFIESLNAIASTELVLNKIILPLAISFFTFQQITYLVDVYRGGAIEHSFLHYCLFVTFFPQLIAGPIVHHKEMLPQFVRNSVYRLRAKHLAVGFSIFAIGLFKKVGLADRVGITATNVFEAAESGLTLTLFEAWAGALAYSLQLYFDFSGYSDMAIGLARMFSIRLPLNFNSPYKATSIISFWRRWHITLSRFLRDYLYTPLGGNHKGEPRRMLNLMITMLLGGLWHGAAWTFVIWGGLHGIFLTINHGWHKIKRKVFNTQRKPSQAGRLMGWTITMIVVVIAWVPFRAASIEGARNLLASMMGANGLALSGRLTGKLGGAELWLIEHGVVFSGMFQNNVVGGSIKGGYLIEILWIIFLLLAVTLLPNTQQLLRRYRPAFETYKNEIPRLRLRWLEWRPTIPWALFITGIYIFSVLSLAQVSEFLYFQF